MSYLGNPLASMNFPVDYFTGTGTTSSFTLSQIPASATSLLVYIGGVKQIAHTNNPAYLVNGDQLVFASAPAANSPIEVIYLGILSQVNVPSSQSITSSMLSLQVSNTFVYQTTTNGSQNTFTLQAPPVSSNSLIVAANGVIQYDYSISGANLVLGFTPPAGTYLRVQSLALAQAGVPNDASVTTQKLAPNLTLSGNTTIESLTANTGPINTYYTTINSDITVVSGTNGFSVGPITLAPGKTVTITPGQRVVTI